MNKQFRRKNRKRKWNSSRERREVRQSASKRKGRNQRDERKGGRLHASTERKNAY